MQDGPYSSLALFTLSFSNVADLKTGKLEFPQGLWGLFVGFLVSNVYRVLNIRVMSQRGETASVYVTWADLVIRLPVPL